MVSTCTMNLYIKSPVFSPEHYVHCQVPPASSRITLSTCSLQFVYFIPICTKNNSPNVLIHYSISQQIFAFMSNFPQYLCHPIDEMTWLVLVKKKMRCSYHFTLIILFPNYISDECISQTYSWLTLSCVPEGYWHSQEIFYLFSKLKIYNKV